MQNRLKDLKFHKIEENFFENKFYIGKKDLESEFFAGIGKIKESKIQEQDLKPLLDEIKLDIDPYAKIEDHQIQKNLRQNDNDFFEGFESKNQI